MKDQHPKSMKTEQRTVAFFPLPFAGAFVAAFAGAFFGAAAFLVVFFGGGSDCSKSEPPASTSISIESTDSLSDASARALPLPYHTFAVKLYTRRGPKVGLPSGRDRHVAVQCTPAHAVPEPSQPGETEMSEAHSSTKNSFTHNVIQIVLLYEGLIRCNILHQTLQCTGYMATKRVDQREVSHHKRMPYFWIE